jgi:glycosyltransferase involved in cell wall biosynthesis
MKPIRVLWLSNKVQSAQARGTGTWLSAAARGLVGSGVIELGNISMGNVTAAVRQDYGSLRQWIVPSDGRASPNDGMPPRPVIAELLSIVEEFSPDLVHVWGTELFWGLLTARGLIRRPALLEMQGLKSAIARVYNGGLTFREQVACIGLKELLRQSTFFHERRRFAVWGEKEREMIERHRFITTQSAWLEAQVSAINGSCRMFHNEFALQEQFYNAAPWTDPGNSIVFCSTSYPSPFKGLHTALRAVAALKTRNPNIKLHIAGAHQKSGLRQDGFVAWLNREARRLDILSNLVWLGPLTVDGIIAELQNCSAVLLPTFIEGYCLALAEAMLLGVPAVVSYTGGTAHLARDEESAVFFPPGDAAMCASQLGRVLEDRKLAGRISRRAREVAIQRNDRASIVERQIDIYRCVLDGTGSQQQ